VSETDDLVAALSPVADAFRGLGISFYVGGSIASTFHGAIRSTMDVDLVCDLPPELDDAFVSASAVRDAVQRRSCFNLIHMPTAYKVDVFVSRGRRFDVRAMQRAAVETIGVGRSVSVPVATAEDSIVSKLEWFRLTDETSERQWDDVSRLVDLHGPRLDTEYMQQMAVSVGVGDLLGKLLSQR
jgi:hypothetical protein